MIKHIKPKTISLGISIKITKGQLNRSMGSINIGDYHRNTAELNRYCLRKTSFVHKFE